MEMPFGGRPVCSQETIINHVSVSRVSVCPVKCILEVTRGITYAASVFLSHAFQGPIHLIIFGCVLIVVNVAVHVECISCTVANYIVVKNNSKKLRSKTLFTCT